MMSPVTDPRRRGLQSCWLRLAVLLCLLCGLLACGPAVKREEVLRVASPDAALDAVLVQTNAGVTASYGYELYLVRHGAAVDGEPAVRLYGATRNDSAYGANLRWRDAGTLVVEYLQARSVEQAAPGFEVDGVQVRVTLESGVRDPDAPPGAMPARSSP